MSASSPDSGQTGGTCSANVPAGQACNALSNVGSSVTPTCMTGTIPRGTGGTIVDGTYVLTAQTYYNSATCSTIPVGGTIELAGGCLQLVIGVPFSGTGSFTYTVQGADITMTETCVNPSGATADTPTTTFTATPTTFTRFIMNSGTGNLNPDRTETYTKH
jgi:hypothetical protein